MSIFLLGAGHAKALTLYGAFRAPNELGKKRGLEIGGLERAKRKNFTEKKLKEFNDQTLSSRNKVFKGETIR